jgi:hypothetical protein
MFSAPCFVLFALVLLVANNGCLAIHHTAASTCLVYALSCQWLLRSTTQILILRADSYERVSLNLAT